MKFLLDHDVYERTARYIESLGHDVLRARHAALAAAPDARVLAGARATGRVLVTRDKGFGLLAGNPPSAPVILLRVAPDTLDAVHEELARVLVEHAEHEIARAIIVVEPGRHRVRRARGSQVSEP